MAAKYYASQPVVIAVDSLPVDSLNRKDSPLARLDYLLPRMAANYNTSYRKAPIIPGHDVEKADAETKAGQFTYGYIGKVWWVPETKELWAILMCTEEGINKFNSGEWSTGFSIQPTFLTVIENNELIIKPYIQHVATCGKDTPALMGTSSPGNAYQGELDIPTLEPIMYKSDFAPKFQSEPIKEGTDMADIENIPAAEEGGGEKSPTESKPAEIINTKELAKLHDAVTKAMKTGDIEAIKKCRTDFKQAIGDARAILDEFEGSASEPAIEPGGGEMPMSTEVNDAQFTAIQAENEQLRELHITSRFTAMGIADEQAAKLREQFKGQPFSTVESTLDVMADTIKHALEVAKLPTDVRFTAGQENVVLPKQMPESVKELEDMGVNGYAALLRTQDEFKDLKFDPLAEYKLKFDELKQKGK